MRGPWLYALLMAIAALFVTATYGEMDPPPSVYRALVPWPDAPQYVDAARALAEEGRYHIHIAGQELPPRFPFGYSLLLAIAQRAGVSPLESPLRVNQLLQWLLLVGITVPFVRRRLWVAGGLAAVLLASRTSFTILARSPLSDLAGVAVLLAGALLLYEAVGWGDRRLWGAAGLALGLALCFRWGFLLLYAMLPAAMWVGRARADRRTPAVAAGSFAVGVAPLLLYQMAVFGSPLATGYDFWLGDTGTFGAAFHPRYIPMQAAALWSELTQQEPGPSTAHLYGGGSYFSPWFVALVAFAAWRLRQVRALRPFLAAGAIYVVLMLCYFSVDSRLYFPLIVLAIPVASLGLADAWQAASRPGRIALALFFAATLLGFPASRGDTDLGDLTRTSSLHMPLPEWPTVEAFNRLHDGSPVLILTDLDPVYVHALTEGDRIVIPLAAAGDYFHNPARFQFGPAERQAALEKALADGHAVFALLGRAPIESLPAVAGRSWKSIELQSPAGRLATLAR